MYGEERNHCRLGVTAERRAARRCSLSAPALPPWEGKEEEKGETLTN